MEEKNSEKIKGADELYGKAIEQLHDFRKLWREYYDKYGGNNGMDYAHEVLRVSDSIDDFERVCGKIHTRVKKHISEKLDIVSGVPRRRFK